MAVNDGAQAIALHECDTCKKQFSTGGNLVRHMRNIHKQTVALPANLTPCALCPEVCPSYRTLEEHYAGSHRLVIETDVMKFPSEEEFLAWKENMERETCAQFVKQSSIKKNYAYYYCHRSGYFSGRGKGKRRLKSKGSNKMNGYCPARIVINKNGCFRVKFIKTHAGHEMDVARCRLTEHEKRDIALKLAQNVPISEILESIQSQAGQKPEPLHLVKRHDIHNIKRDFLEKETRLQRSNGSGDTGQIWGGNGTRREAQSGEMWRKNGQVANENEMLLVIMDEGNQEIMGMCKKGRHCTEADDATEREVEIHIEEPEVDVKWLHEKIMVDVDRLIAFADTQSVERLKLLSSMLADVCAKMEKSEWCRAANVRHPLLQS